MDLLAPQRRLEIFLLHDGIWYGNISSKTQEGGEEHVA